MASNIPYELLQQGIPQINPAAAGQLGLSGINAAISAQGQNMQAAQAQAQIEAQMQMQRQALAAQQQREEAQRQFELQKMQQEELMKQQLAQEASQRAIGVANTSGGYDIQKEVIRAQQKAAEQKQALMLGLMQENRLSTSTDFLRNLAAAGIDPNSDLGKQMLTNSLKRGVTVNTGDQLEKGYMWLDDTDHSKGVRPIPGSSHARLSGESARNFAVTTSAQEDIKDYRDLIIEGKITNPALLSSKYSPNFLQSTDEQKIQLLNNQIVDKIARLRTGAAITKTEEEMFARLIPMFGDDKKTIDDKLKKLNREFKIVADSVKGTDTQLTRQDEGAKRRVYNPATGKVE